MRVERHREPVIKKGIRIVILVRAGIVRVVQTDILRRLLKRVVVEQHPEHVMHVVRRPMHIVVAERVIVQEVELHVIISIRHVTVPVGMLGMVAVVLVHVTVVLPAGVLYMEVVISIVVWMVQ